MNAVISTKPRTTVIGNIVRSLRDAIMQAHLVPGQKLVESELATVLDVSRPSLREALRALQAERLIELIPHRGPFVSNLGRHEVQEIHEVWALLTGEAVYRFASAANETEIDAIERAAANVERTMPRATVLRRMEAINRFFGLILSKSGNTILAEIVGSLVCRINFLRARSLVERRIAEQYATEIRAIARHIRAKNPKAARAAMQAHIDSVCSAAIEMHAHPALDTRQLAKLLRTSMRRRSTSKWYESTKIARSSTPKK